ASINPTSLSQGQQTSAPNLVAQRQSGVQKFKLRGIRASIRRTGGFARGYCGGEEMDLAPLWPQNTEADLSQMQEKMGEQTPQEKESTGVQVTVAKRPTFLVYISETTKQQAVFTLQTEQPTANGDTVIQDVHEAIVSLPGRPGIVRVSVPENVELEPGQPYHWSFSIICQPNDWSLNLSVDGWVERMEPEGELVNVENQPERDRPSMYEEAGIWTEAVSSLALLRERNPNDPTLKAEWESLLESVGLAGVVEQPLIGPLTTVED
ncbi:MAG TPA: hypothetical protein DCL61_12110, partial [Cyanobacteria bacterium UBA12227]|nr:hypothetical protein [Cyanobacteria bacterium UBA12227]